MSSHGPTARKTLRSLIIDLTLYTNVQTRSYHYRPHSHRGLTTHLVVRGELTITYPEDEAPTKTTHSVGDRVDVAAGRIHEVWVGPEGCTYVIGE